MKYTLYSGISKEISLTKNQLEEWIKCFQTDKKFEVVLEDMLIGINPKLIAQFDLRQVK